MQIINHATKSPDERIPYYIVTVYTQSGDSIIKIFDAELLDLEGYLVACDVMMYLYDDGCREIDDYKKSPYFHKYFFNDNFVFDDEFAGIIGYDVYHYDENGDCYDSEIVFSQMMTDAVANPYELYVPKHHDDFLLNYTVIYGE
jgi:hypothetical protein